MNAVRRMCARIACQVGADLMSRGWESVLGNAIFYSSVNEDIHWARVNH